MRRESISSANEDCEARQLLEWTAVFGCSMSSIASMPLHTSSGLFMRYLIAEARKYAESGGEPRVTWEAAKAWEDCGIAQAQRELLVMQLAALIEERAAYYSASDLILVDLGAGTGRVVWDLCRVVQRRGQIKEISCILVESNSDACVLASRYGRAQDIAALEVINGDMREFDWAGLIAPLSALVLVIASQSMHEVPWTDKETVLRAIRDRGCDLVISELEGDHDRTLFCGQPLISSVCRFYGQLVDSVMRCAAPLGAQDGALLVVEGFLIQEALRLLTEKRGRRGNYHLNRERWERLVRDAGFEGRCLHYGDVEGFDPPLWIGAGLSSNR